ncbi:MAG: hypothetical protein ABIN61_04315 [candidate division WOR-3 bacterium]
MEIVIETKDFSFEKTFNSGLFYFFYEDEPKRVIYFEKNKIELFFKQEGDDLIITLSQDIKEKEKLINRISYCFGLNEDLSFFYLLCEKDPVLSKFLPLIKSTRVISAFSDFEALVGAIISQNNSYRNYRKQMREVYRTINFIPEKYKEKELKKIKLGYKIPYIIELVKNFGKLEVKNIKGIGNYSLNLYKIFQKRDYNAFYVDCLTKRIMQEKYGIYKDFEENSKKLWGNYRGLAEAYLQRFFEKK